MVIKILSLVSSCDTNQQGVCVKHAILDALRQQDIVYIDFSGVTNVTSSFVNSALLDLSPQLDLDTIKSRVRIKRVNRQIGNMIKDRFTSEARLHS
ncbi:STAS-like domain-containing protein [Loktanella sp. 5RATIMAR09]|uniref:STAS-like domain-containing protein n=1 Tax=Loktanella sp. 5RATIMAR09 TaxID=1225655 RepID=UPI0009F8BE4B